VSSVDNASLETYGRLTEGLHVAGYTFERAAHNLESLLRGDAWQLGGRFKDVNAFLDSLRFDNLRAAAETRARIAKRIKELQPKATNRAIARTLGVDHKTVGKDVGENSPRRVKKANEINRGNGENSPRGFSGEQAAKTVARAERVADRQGTVAGRLAKISFDAAKLGKSSVLLADPPWDDEFGPSNRSIENHYPTMPLEDICALPVSAIAHEHAMLFLWTTPSMIEMALSVVRAWGFEYRTQMVWVKPFPGKGKYARQQHEILLICRRGDHPAPDPTSLPNSVIAAPRGKHSEKPEIFYEIIERMYPELPKIELFARRARPGWAAWGNEAPPQDAREMPDMPDFLRRTSDQAAS
jgi:N6-adenosine-specific RNA methylase IME4